LHIPLQQRADGRHRHLGFNVPQSGPYADEGADELRAYELAVEHLNGGGDGGMLNTFSSKVLDGTGIWARRSQFVTGDTQTKSDAARASAKSMIEKDGAIMISGGSSSGVAVAVQALCQEAGVIFMAGLTHCQRHHRQGQEGQRFPSLLQLLHVRCSPRTVLPRNTATTARPIT
jgi:ABC-type branched-subunit amino acid transport system substrate-binding protein